MKRKMMRETTYPHVYLQLIHMVGTQRLLVYSLVWLAFVNFFKWIRIRMMNNTTSR